MGAEEGVPGGEEELGLDVEDEVEMGDEEASPENEELLARVVRAVADELGVEATIEGEGEEEVEVEDELEMDVEEPDGEELEMGAEAEEEEPVGPMMELARAMTRVMRETGAEDTGASAGDESETDEGEEDYTTKKGDELKHDEWALECRANEWYLLFSF